MSDFINISCKCITFARVELLEEAIHSFLIQEYEGESELIIVNDYPLQTLIYEHPRIKIFNLPYTFKTIGEKENFAISKCKYDVIAVWDDDDIALPNHLSNINKYFKEGSDLLHWQNAVFYNEPKITALMAVGNSGIVYSRKAYISVGGHPIENAGGDMTFVLSIKALSKNIVLANPPDEECSWFYMWGGRAYHLSGEGTDVPGKKNIIQRHSEYIETRRMLGKIPTGNIPLYPHWNKDYKQMLIDFIKK